MTLRKAEKDLSEVALVAAAKSGGPGTRLGRGREVRANATRFMPVVCRVDTGHRWVPIIITLYILLVVFQC